MTATASDDSCVRFAVRDPFVSSYCERPPSLPDASERIAHFIETLSEQNAKIIIPAPVLGEFLVLAREDGPLCLASLHESDVFEIVPYDEQAAVEAAALMIKARDEGDKRGGATGSWQKIKVDWQIAAIAKLRKADCLYSEDGDLARICTTIGMTRKGISDLPPPPPQEVRLPLESEGDEH